VLWYLNFPKPVSVTAMTHDLMGRRAAEKSGRGFDVEDSVEAFIVFDNGISLTLHVSWAANIPEDNLIELRLLGTDAGIVERNIDQGYSFDALIFQEQDGVYLESGVANVASGLIETPMHHFVEAICNDRPHQPDADAAIASMRLIDAIYESAASGHPVAL
jgi:predicted dehydrogenase